MNTSRILGWGAFLAVAAGLAGYPELFPRQDDLAPAAQRAPATASRAVATAAAPLRDLAPGADLFAAQTWAVAPPAPTAEQLAALQQQQQAPLPPSAPPLPFQFIGRLADSRDLQVFLQNGEKLYVVRKGDVIDDTWRIESINDKALSLVYLPLHLTQTLSVGSNP